MPAALRVQGGAVDGVEAFGRLAVPLGKLGAEAAGVAADRIGRDVVEAAVAAHPELELEFHLEDADQDRCTRLDAVRREALGQTGQVGRPRQRRAGGVDQPALGALEADLARVGENGRAVVQAQRDEAGEEREDEQDESGRSPPWHGINPRVAR